MSKTIKRPRTSFNPEVSLTNLSDKFSELEKIHLGFLRKSQKDNERRLEAETHITQELQANIARSQNNIQENMKYLSNLGDSYRHELTNLKTFLNQNERGRTQSTEKNRSGEQLQQSMENNFESLKNNIFALSEIERLERKTSYKMEMYFQQAIEGAKAIVSQYSDALRKFEHTPERSRKSHDFRKTNLLSVNYLQTSFEASKKELQESFHDMNHWTTSYNQEAAFLSENLQQIKLHVSTMAAEISTALKTSSNDPAVPKDRNNLLVRLRRSLPVTEEIILQCISMSLKKDQIFVDMKQQVKNTHEGILHHLSQVPEHIEVLRANLDNIGSDKLKAQEAQKPDSHELDQKLQNPQTHYLGGFIGTNLKDKSNMGKGYSTEKLNWIQTVGKNKAVKASPLLVGRSLQSFTKSLYDETDTQDKTKHSKASNVAYNESNEGMGTRLAQVFEGGETDRDFDASPLDQRLISLRLSVKNFMNSAEKVVKLLPRNSIHEQTTLEIYKNDKRMLENYLNMIPELEPLPQKLMKTAGNLPDSKQHIRSSSVGRARVDKGSSEVERRFRELGRKQVIEDYGEVSDERLHKKQRMPHHQEQHQEGDVSERKRSKQRGGSVERAREIRSAGLEENRIQANILRADLEDLKAQCEALKHERVLQGKERDANRDSQEGEVKVERRGHSHKPRESREIKLNELAEDNERLFKENEKLGKTVVRLRKKADERKKTLKQLFELMTEKEKELNVYKWSAGAGINTKSMQAVEEIVSKKYKDMEKVCDKLQGKLSQKEKDLIVLEAKVSDLKRLQSKSNKELKIDTEEKKHLRSLSKEKLDKEEDKNRLKAQARHKEIEHDMEDLLKQQVAKKKEKRITVDTRRAETDTSPNKTEELRSILNVLKNQKDKLIGEMQGLEEVMLSHRIQTEESLRRDDMKISKRDSSTLEEQQSSSGEDAAGLKEILIEKEYIIEQLVNEKNDLEEKCGQLLKDMELAQEHRKRMEKSYQDAINLLDEKVTGLNDYIQDLETRNTERMRRSLTPERRKTPSPLRSQSQSPTRKIKKFFNKESATKWNSGTDMLKSKLREIFELIGVEREEYNSLDCNEQINKLQQYVSSKKFDDNVGADLENQGKEEGFLDRDNGKEIYVERGRERKEQDFTKTSVKDILDAERSRETAFISRLTRLLKEKGVLVTLPAEAQKDKDRGQILVEEIEQMIVHFKNMEEEYSGKLAVTEKELEDLRQEVSQREQQYEEQMELAEKNYLHAKKRLEEREEVLKEKDLELKERAEQVRSIDADRRQRYVEVEALRKTNEGFGQEKEKLRKVIELKENEKQQLNERINEIEQELQIVEQSKKEEIANLQMNLKEKEVVLSQLESTMGEINQKSEKAEGVKESFAQAKEKIAEMTKKLASKETELNKSLNGLEKAQKHIGELNELIAQKQIEIEKLQKEFKRTQKELRNREEVINENDKLLAEKDTEILDIKAACARDVEEVTQAQEAEKKEHQAQITDLQAKLERLTNDMKALTKELGSLKEKNKVKTEECEKLQEEVDVLQTQLNQQEEDLNAMRDSHQEEINKYEASMAEKDNNIEVLNKELDQVKKDLNETAETNEKLTRECNDRNNEVMKLLREKEALFNAKTVSDEKSDETVKTIQNTISHYEEIIHSNLEKITGLEKQNETLKKEKEEIKRVLAESEVKIRDLTGLEDQIEKIKEEIVKNQEDYASNLENSNNENTRLSKEISLLQEQAGDWRNKVEELKQESLLKNNTIGTYKVQLSEIEKQRDSLKQENNDLLAFKEKSQAENQDLQDKVLSAEEELDTRKSEISQLGQEIEQLLVKNKEAVEKYKHANEELKTLESASENYKTKLQGKEDEIKNLNNTISELRAALKESLEQGIDLEKSEISRLNQELDREKERYEKLSQEYEAFREKISQELENVKKERDEITQIVTDLETEKASLQERVSHYEEELRDANNKNQESVQGNEAERNKIIQELKDLEHERDEAKKLIERLENEKMELNARIKQGAEEKAEILSVVNELENNKAILENSIKELEDEKVKMNAATEELMRERHEAQQYGEKMALQNQNLEKEIEKLNIEKVHSVNSVEALNNEKEHLRKQIEDLKHKQANVQAHSEEIERERDEVLKQIKSLEKDKKALLEQVERVENDITEKESYVQKLENEKEELIQKVQELEKERNLARLGAQDLDREKDEVRKYIEKLETEKEELRVSARKADKDHEDNRKIINQLDSERKTLREKTEELEKEKEELQDVIAELKRKKNETDIQIEEFIAEINNVQEVLTKEKEDKGRLTTTIQKLESEVQNLRSDLDRKDTELGQCKEIISNLEEQKNKLLKELDQCNEDQQSTKSGIAVYEQEKSQLNKQLQEVSREKDNLAKHVGDIEKEKVELGHALESAVKQKNEAQILIEKVQDEADLLKAQVLKVEQERDGARKEVEEARKQITSLQTEKEGLLERVKQYGEEINNLNVRLQEIQNEGDKNDEILKELNLVKEQSEGLCKENRELKDEIQHLTERQNETDNYVITMEDERDTTKKRLSELEIEKNTLEANYKRIDKEKADAMRYAERVGDEADDLRRKNDELIKSLDIISHEASMVKDNKNSSRLSEFESEAFKASDRFEQVKYELEIVRKDEAALKAQLETKGREVEDLNKQNSELQREKEQLKKDFEKRLNQLRGKKSGQASPMNQQKFGNLDYERLADQNQTLQDQNDNIKKMMVILQEQVIALNEEKQQAQTTDRGFRDVQDALREGLLDLAKEIDQSINVRFETRQQIEETFGKIQEKLKSREELERETIQRLIRIAGQAEETLREVTGELPDLTSQISGKRGPDHIEEIILSYLNNIKTAFYSHVGHTDRVRSGHQTGELRSPIEIREIREISFKQDSNEPYTIDVDWTSPHKGEEAKQDFFAKSTTERGITPDEPKTSARSMGQNEIEAKLLYEQLKKAHEDYDKLDSEFKQMANNYDMIKFLNEDLKNEVTEREEEIKRTNFQVNVLKEELAKLEREKRDSGLDHEKQHIRTMFVKFFSSAVEGQKDALDLLKLLLSLLGFTEEQKNDFLAASKSKSNKKSMFGKLF